MTAHLAIDTVGAKHGGGAVVALRVVNAALNHDGVRQVTVFSSPSAQRRFEWPTDPRLTVVEPHLPWPSDAWRIAWTFVGIAQATRRAGADALLCLSNAGVGPREVPTTLFIQQPVPFCAEAMQRLSVRLRLRVSAAQRMTRRSALQSTRTLVQTPTMQSWVSQQFGLSSRRIFVVPPEPAAAPSLLRVTDPLDQLLYVGSDSAHKNLEFLGRALTHCARAGLPHELLCTLPAEHPLVQRYAWRALDYLPQEALWPHYARAKALVMPSLTETIGLPLIEAMQSDLPVLVADRPYAHDVCGAAALYFDPNDSGSFCDALRRLCSEPALVQTLIAEGRKRVATLHAQRGYGRMIELALGVEN